jgi:hypothetical protein
MITKAQLPFIPSLFHFQRNPVGQTAKLHYISLQTTTWSPTSKEQETEETYF